jgi:predicted transcriptional regulator
VNGPEPPSQGVTDTIEDRYLRYLREALRDAEDDVREGRTLTHEEVVSETAKWFAESSE